MSRLGHVYAFSAPLKRVWNAAMNRHSALTFARCSSGSMPLMLSRLAPLIPPLPPPTVAPESEVRSSGCRVARSRDGAVWGAQAQHWTWGLSSQWTGSGIGRGPHPSSTISVVMSDWISRPNRAVMALHGNPTLRRDSRPSELAAIWDVTAKSARLVPEQVKREIPARGVAR